MRAHNRRRSLLAFWTPLVRYRRWLSVGTLLYRTLPVPATARAGRHPTRSAALALRVAATRALSTLVDYIRTSEHRVSGLPPMAKLVGIDLGTTFCAIATLDDHGQAVTLPNRDGEMLTPSAVLIEDGVAVVGEAARDVALEQPDKVATLIKRRMGHPTYGRPVAGRDFRPET